MKLHQPFINTPRLLPGLRLGSADSGAWLSLMGTEPSYENRDLATLTLDLPDGSTYTDRSLRSGSGGFKGQVEVFESFLSFLLAAVESLEYERRTGRDGESTDLFPINVRLWAADNESDIDSARIDMCDENGVPNETLIEEV